jgi:hypothetical protein
MMTDGQNTGSSTYGMGTESEATLDDANALLLQQMRGEIVALRNKQGAQAKQQQQADEERAKQAQMISMLERQNAALQKKQAASKKAKDALAEKVKKLENKPAPISMSGYEWDWKC